MIPIWLRTYWEHIRYSVNALAVIVLLLTVYKLINSFIFMKIRRIFHQVFLHIAVFLITMILQVHFCNTNSQITSSVIISAVPVFVCLISFLLLLSTHLATSFLWRMENICERLIHICIWFIFLIISVLHGSITEVKEISEEYFFCLPESSRILLSFSNKYSTRSGEITSHVFVTLVLNGIMMIANYENRRNREEFSWFKRIAESFIITLSHMFVNIIALLSLAPTYIPSRPNNDIMNICILFLPLAPMFASLVTLLRISECKKSFCLCSKGGFDTDSYSINPLYILPSKEYLHLLYPRHHPRVKSNNNINRRM